MTIEYTTYLPSGKEEYEFDAPHCCLDPHPQLVFLTGGSWMVECKNCASNLIAIEIKEVTAGPSNEGWDEMQPVTEGKE